MTLHVLSHRDQVSGRFVTRCGLTGYKDTRALPREVKVGEVYDGFATALHERDVDCPGCRIALSALGLLLLRLLSKHPDGLWLRPADKFSVNDNRALPRVYVPIKETDALAARRLIVFNGDAYVITPLGRSLAERNSK